MNQTANNVEVRNVSEQPIKITGGRLKQFTSQWQCITSDPFILNSVKNYKIEFENGEPMQFMPPKEINFTKPEQEVIDNEIDKLLTKGESVEDCQANINDTCDLFSTLGFILHPDKSVLQPVQVLTFLGFVLDSVNMTVSLTQEKIQRIRERCKKMMELVELPIQELASFIGLLVSSFPGILYGPLYYRQLERDKTTALRQNYGNYNAQMRLSQESFSEIKWWYDNIQTNNYPILLPNSKVDVIIYTDASTKGWGAVKETEKIGGRWSEEEAKYHINCLELLAAIFGLKAFCKNEPGIHVKIYSDNSTTVNYINAMGGVHSRECHTIAKDIWQWCIEKQIWLTAAHIPGTKNVEADRESRVFSDNKEWMIRSDIFQQITDIWGEPSIDLFASRLNHQVPCYVSWKPDPGAAFIDAFSFNCKMPTENTNRLCRGIDDSSNVANPELVSQTSSHVSGCSKSVTTTTNCLTNAGDATRSPPPIQENGSDCMQIVRQSYETQGISQKATSIILQSWRKGTTKQYSSYIKRWTTYCHKKQIDPVSATVPQALDFLVELFESGIGYSGINTARSALSSVLKPVDGMTFGAQESVKRFLKGVYEARPSNPRYTETWDVSKVLNYLKTISITDCSLKDLTLKLVTLMSLVSAQRGQTIHYLSLEDMVVSETSDFYYLQAY
ncbi:uncharacterized protein [Pocillopora verrucosa]|uniref:uncharacterized protein n=1 Tax=Pocillopora verrucosa TaxID=203993 RepID=UPI00333F1F78